MANETLVLARQGPDEAPSEADYQSFCAALGASARGRAFLAEFARRNRHADTKVLLAALDRLEAQLRSQSAAGEADRIRQELRALLAAMRVTRPEIDAGAAAIKAAKLAALIGFIEHRIELIVAPQREHTALPDEVAALVLPDGAAAEAARLVLAVVPPAEEPELPMPSRAAAPPPMTLVAKAPAPTKHVAENANAVFGRDQAQQEREPEKAKPEPARVWEPLFGSDTEPAEELHTAALMPEVGLFDSTPPRQPATMAMTVASPPAPAVVEQALAAPPPAVATLSPPAPIALPAIAAFAIEAFAFEAFDIAQPAPPAAPTAPAADLLAAIMALSEEERLALFT